MERKPNVEKVFKKLMECEDPEAVLGVMKILFERSAENLKK